MKRKRKLWMVAGIFLAIFLSVPVLASQETQNPDLPVATPTPEAPQVPPQSNTGSGKKRTEKRGRKILLLCKRKESKE